MQNEANFPPRRAGQGLGDTGPWAIVQNKPNFRRAEVFHHSNTPLFQHSNPMPIVRNEPNLPGVKYAKRTQSPATPGGTAHHSNIPLFHHSNPVPIVRNKANLARPGQGLDGQKMRNEPNLPAATLGRAGPIVRNKANWPPGRCRARTPNLRRGAVVRNKANSRPCRVGRGHRGVGRGANVQNEANFGTSFKCKVSSFKRRVRTSNFTLET
jgi:hypothetical protein